MDMLPGVFIYYEIFVIITLHPPMGKTNTPTPFLFEAFYLWAVVYIGRRVLSTVVFLHVFKYCQVVKLCLMCYWADELEICQTCAL